MGLFSAMFGGKDESSQERAEPKKLADNLVPVPYELMVPWLPPSLLGTLKRRAERFPLVTWRVREGDSVPFGTIIAQFNLDWSGINTKNVFKERRSEILGGSVLMQCDGIVRFTSIDESDRCFCSIQPLVEERDTFLYQERYRGVSREDYEDKLRYKINPHDFYFPTCEAMWMILTYDPTGENTEDPDKVLNRDIKLIDTVVVRVQSKVGV